jgi:serine/threonine protein kinase
MAIGISDIIGAKLIAQLGWVPADTLREDLVRLDRAPGRQDLLGQLLARSALDAAKVAKVRRYTDLYERVRREALYVALIERAQLLPKEELAQWKERIEQEGYTTSLGEHLVAAKRVTPMQAGQLRQQQFVGLDKEDERLFAGYRKNGFQGVGRPITKNPQARIDTRTFTIKELFRSAESQRLARSAMLHTQSEPGETTPGLRAPLPIRPSAAMPEKVGPYKIERVLGRGGMGLVLLARHENGGDPVALKLAHSLGAMAADEVKARMRREILATSMLNHENIIQVLDAGDLDGGSPYLVMELVTGRELRDLLRERQSLPPREALAIFVQILAAAGAAHAAGIIHRDLKPENVLITEKEGRLFAKLMDFGLARILEVDPAHQDMVFKTKATDVVSGSPHYLSPEQVLGDEVGPPADLYALGVVLFELLTGQLPWAAATMNEVLRAHVSKAPRSLAEAKPDASFPPALEALVRALLEKVPNKRPKNAEAVIAKIEQEILPALAIAAPSAAPAQPALKPGRGITRILDRLQPGTEPG